MFFVFYPDPNQGGLALALDTVCYRRDHSRWLVILDQRAPDELGGQLTL